MKLSGTIKLISNPVSGTSKSGKDWAKQEFVITLDGGGNYPDELCISAFGDEKIAIVQTFAIGQHIDILVDTRAQEYNGRFFNSINLYRVGQEAPALAQPPVTYDTPADYGRQAPQPTQADIDFNTPQDDGLPF